MRPYLRTPYRRRRANSTFLEKVVNYLTPFYEDLRTLWTFDAPYPFSIKVLITAGVCTLLVLPPLYLLVPPIFTLVAFQLLLGPDLCPYDFWQWPPVQIFKYKLDPTQRKLFVAVVQNLAEFFVFKSSIIVGFIDYIQMLRGIEFEIQEQEAN